MDEGLAASHLFAQCVRKQAEFNRLFRKLILYQETYQNSIFKTRKKAKLHLIHKDLHNLMRTRYKQLFGIFACAKSLICRLQPLLNGKKLDTLVRQYEQTPPLSLYLNQICQAFEDAFDILHHTRKERLSCFEHLFCTLHLSTNESISSQEAIPTSTWTFLSSFSLVTFGDMIM